MKARTPRTGGAASRSADDRPRSAGSRPRNARSKVLAREPLLRAVRRARRRGERIVFTNGCFDLLHQGHVRSLEQARALGDRLIVAINGDASVRRLKGPGRPLVPARQRMEVVAALECVDWVTAFHADTPLALIRAVLPDVLAKGGDWALDEIVGREEVEAAGGRVARLREVPGVRTTSIAARARQPKRGGRARRRKD